jgi:hypothetical protein
VQPPHKGASDGRAGAKEKAREEKQQDRGDRARDNRDRNDH